MCLIILIFNFVLLTSNLVVYSHSITEYSIFRLVTGVPKIPAKHLSSAAAWVSLYYSLLDHSPLVTCSSIQYIHFRGPNKLRERSTVTRERSNDLRETLK